MGMKEIPVMIIIDAWNVALLNKECLESILITELKMYNNSQEIIMEDNKNCILLKRKEYDELVKLANSKKPDEVWISMTRTIGGTYDGKYSISYNSGMEKFEVGKQLYSQINRILKKYDEELMISFEKRLEEMKKPYLEKIKQLKNAHNDIITKLKSMSRFEMHRYLKNYEYWMIDYGSNSK